MEHYSIKKATQQVKLDLDYLPVSGGGKTYNMAISIWND